MIGLWLAVTNRLDYLLFQVCFFGMQNAPLQSHVRPELEPASPVRLCT